MEKMMQSYIVSGLNRETITRKARELAARAVCLNPKNGAACGECRHCRKARENIHPDIITIERENNSKGALRAELTVDQIRRIAGDASILPNEAERKVYILPEADKMNIAAQNAFLKLLEEPPAWVVFVLAAANVSLLLPTVRSRCAEIRVESEEEKISPDAEKRARGYLEALGDSVRMLELCSAMEKLDTAEVREFIAAAKELAPEILPPDEKLLRLEEELSTMEKWMRVNTGSKHILAYLATVEL